MRVAASALAIALALPLSGGTAVDRPVADAAQRGDFDRVRQLLRNGADVNLAQGDGMTALHWAAERNDVALGEALVYAGANVNAGTRIGHYTPLHIAARKGHVEIANVLLAAKADPEGATTNSGVRPLHLAAASGEPEVVTALVRSGADVDATEGAWGQTPLIFAAAAGRTETIRALLQAGADPSIASRSVDVIEREKADKAAEKRLSQFLADFKEKEGGGTDWQPTPAQVQAAIDASREIQRRWPNVPDPEDDEEEETDSDAEKKSQGETDAEKEEEKPKPHTYGELVGGWGGLTPLLHAVRQGHVEAVIALLERGADINQPSTGDHTTPLLMATINGHFDLALDLLEMGADPELASDAGATPLFAVLERMWAPRSSYAHPTEHHKQRATHLEVMEALLRAGADPNARLSKHLWYMEYTFSVLGTAGIHYQGATPLWRAAHALDVDAMRMLKDYGADPNIPTTKLPPRPKRGCEDKDKAPEAKEASTETADVKNPKMANAEGESAAKETEGEEEEDDCKEEEDHSGIPEVAVGGPFLYPIHVAAGAGYGQHFAGNAHRYVPGNWLKAVRFLVEECGAEVDIRDANAYTALHHAASRGDNELIRYLVAKGADVTVVSRKGQTTADMANGPIQRVSPFPDTIELLVSLGAINNNKCVSC